MASVASVSAGRYGDEVEVAPGGHATFVDAGHILGSAIIHLRVQDTVGGDERIIFRRLHPPELERDRRQHRAQRTHAISQLIADHAFRLLARDQQPLAPPVRPPTLRLGHDPLAGAGDGQDRAAAPAGGPEHAAGRCAPYRAGGGCGRGCTSCSAVR